MGKSELLRNMAPITSFNRGQASKYFNDAAAGKTIIVVKNNKPISAICGVEEYILRMELCEMLEKEIAHSTDGFIQVERILPFLEKISQITEEYNDV